MTVFRILSRRRRPAATVLLIASALAGCGSSANKTTTTVSALPAVTVKAANGVAIPRDAVRIVSLSASATEDLYAVGAGKQVVAVDSYSTYPANAPRTSLSGTQPNVEAIARYRPDLVVNDANVNNLVSLLAKLHIPLLIDPPPTTLDGAYAQLDQLGAATGHEAQAVRVASGMRAQIASLVSSVPRPKLVMTVYHELDQTFYSASSRTFIGQLYSLVGLRNIADKVSSSAAYPQLSSEYVIASNPDLIVLADTVCCGQSYGAVAKRPGWSHIAAVKNHAVLAVNDSVASEWGPRIVLFLRTVAVEVRHLESGK
jgi:ABC-type Fe3+-hydroxamate transport system substrate-binding protein